ncbi:hypothetical protein Clacol_005301 [Clathrus columnatus]|uniref:Nudix hydrolase domain-containing protein n=1 Tax=Clathrus columnatus TaxID=1419009 RepID=A0AAV5A9Q7_9AGAM|nr:hypothetical protein Clacol_005301 [Clathrus columnatus]
MTKRQAPSRDELSEPMNKNPKNSPLLWNFHRPHKPWESSHLKVETIKCLRNLSAYRAPKLSGHLPRSRRAAVLVALFIGRGGDLYVILSRRSDALRTYPGDTSLPGGKTENYDHSLENAARREAFEEIGLPLDKSKVPLLCSLEPFLSGNHMLVTPVVVLVLDKSLRPFLNAREVHSIFSHPLYGFLTTLHIREPEPLHKDDDGLSPAYQSTFQDTQKSGSSSSDDVSKEEVQHLSKSYHTFRDITWHNRPVRMHSFLTGREFQGVKPITGLTSAILIRVAQIGYNRDTEFEVNAPGQLSLEDRIAVALFENDVLRKACQNENIDMKEWKKRKRIKDQVKRCEYDK